MFDSYFVLHTFATIFLDIECDFEIERNNQKICFIRSCSTLLRAMRCDPNRDIIVMHVPLKS